MKDAELGAVIMDLLACQPVLFVERVDAAEWKLNVTAGRRQTLPQMTPTNDCLCSISTGSARSKVGIEQCRFPKVSSPSGPALGLRSGMTGRSHKRLVALLHSVSIDVQLAAHLPEFFRHLCHALFFVVQRGSIVAHVLRDLHRAELRAAHGAEMRHLVCFLRQRLVMIFTRG